MISFSRFLPDEGCIYKVVLSLLQDLPDDEDTADILAEYFYDSENLDPDVQDKLHNFLSRWQSIVTKPEDDGKSAKPSDSIEEDENDGRKSVTFLHSSPRGQILSVYFQKQCDTVIKVISKKKKVFGGYEEFMYDRSGKVNKTDSLKERKRSNGNSYGVKVGSRPFETKMSYVEFLDNFFDISFSEVKNYENVKGRNYLPLLKLGPFVDEICAQQFQELRERTGRDTQKRQSLVIMTTPRKTDSTGLNSPYRGGENVTGLVSKFSKSEDVLYKDSFQENVAKWSLNINFGTKYLHLQDTLDWISSWGRRHHALGLRGDTDSELKPSMKIDVPPTLVVLSLWLLENKYLPPKNGSKSKNNSGQEGQGHNLSVIQEDAFVSASIPNIESQIIVNKDPRNKRRQGSKREQRPNGTHEFSINLSNLSASAKSSRSNADYENEYDQEAEDVHTAYEKILDR